MIKKSTYIRNFTPKQVRLMEQIQATNKKLKTVPDILFFTLENAVDLLNDVERLKRIIDLKQKKIDQLNNKIEDANI